MGGGEASSVTGTGTQSASQTQKSPHRIAVLPGDGIGKEVMPEALLVLEAAAKKFHIPLAMDHFDFASCDYYAKH
ncbi:MAG: hypothetical protein EB006_06045, partial [Betaproteobacteria bacterium]|nr:hypothetical protein [Betaproteobacteria bacterium]